MQAPAHGALPKNCPWQGNGLTHSLHLHEGQDVDGAWIWWTERLAAGISRRDKLSVKTNKQQSGEVKKELLPTTEVINISVAADWGRAGTLPLLFRPVSAVTPSRWSAADTRAWRRLNYCDAGLNQRGLQEASSVELLMLAWVRLLLWRFLSQVSRWHSANHHFNYFQQ